MKLKYQLGRLSKENDNPMLISRIGENNASDKVTTLHEPESEEDLINYCGDGYGMTDFVQMLQSNRITNESRLFKQQTGTLSKKNPKNQ